MVLGIYSSNVQNDFGIKSIVVTGGYVLHSHSHYLELLIVIRFLCIFEVINSLLDTEIVGGIDGRILGGLELDELSIPSQNLLDVRILVVPVIDPVQLGSRPKMCVSKDLIVHAENRLDLLESRGVGIVVETDESSLFIISLLRQIIRVLGLEAVGKFS